MDSSPEEIVLGVTEQPEIARAREEASRVFLNIIHLSLTPIRIINWCLIRFISDQKALKLTSAVIFMRQIKQAQYMHEAINTICTDTSCLFGCFWTQRFATLRGYRDRPCQPLDKPSRKNEKNHTESNS
jgi:hypothetical protein